MEQHAKAVAYGLQQILKHAQNCEKLGAILQAKASVINAKRAPSMQVKGTIGFCNTAPSLVPSDSISQAQPSGSQSGGSSVLMGSYVREGNKSKHDHHNKIFSVIPTSMIDEQTTSTMSWLNSPQHNHMQAATITSTVQVQEWH
ncbi:hypothetical protein FRB95_010085 [Tulasnella sp. JGI-2019a]|nr:hypothetical protein FRB95_010085 [Tulasnella sp. JGI-2019a]